VILHHARRRIIQDYLVNYHEARCHQGPGRDSPDGRKPEVAMGGEVISESMVGEGSTICIGGWRESFLRARWGFWQGQGFN
jgi:hypothetical protein